VLDHDARVLLHRQIETSIRDSIRAGQLPQGSPLPLSRVLAADLGVSRGVVVEAYRQLTAEGLPGQPRGRIHPRGGRPVPRRMAAR
jgi:GntR family transcriptional regulator / MocR family aminotransferase